ESWPAEVVAESRARRRLMTTTPAESSAVLDEVQTAGFPALALRLATHESAGADALAEARAHLARGDADGAGAIARRILANLTGAARLEPLLMLGMSQVGARRHAEALGSFEEAQSVAPADARAYNYEARVRLGNGDALGARKALERGLAHVPGD